MRDGRREHRRSAYRAFHVIMALGFLSFAVLSLLAVAAALSVARRAEWSSRAEALVGTTMIAHALVSVPILTLGWFGVLYRPTLAATVAGCSLATIAATRRGPWRSHLAGIADLGWQIHAAVLELVATAWRTRHVALVGIVTSIFAVFWTLLASYVTPSSSWDGIWYHETIVGYAIQNHGFGLVDIPKSLDYVTSFPKVCETINLWLVFFTDRRLIEAADTLVSPALIASCYVMARRYESDRLMAAGWASVFFLVPGIVLQLRSTYIDVHVATLLLAATMFVTRPELRVRDACVAGLTLALLAGSKGHALTWLPFLAPIALVRLCVGHSRARPVAVLGTLLFSIVMMGVIAAPTYIRNWLVFKNPIYPVDYHIGKVHWPGWVVLDELKRPFWPVVVESFGPHVPGKDFSDTIQHPYGYALSFVVLPLLVIGMPVAVVRLVRSYWPGAQPDRAARNLMLVMVPLLATAPLSPALWSTRYNIHLACALVLGAVWTTSRAGLRIFREGALGAASIASVIMLTWADPRWGIPINDVIELTHKSAEERAVYHWLMYTVPLETGRARETELGPGDVVTFTDNYTFPSILWNERFSNRIVYVPYAGDATAFLDRLRAVRAKWTTAPAGSEEFGVLTAATQEWEQVGLMSITRNWTAFRRRSM
jgi:hypothetical protein